MAKKKFALLSYSNASMKIFVGKVIKGSTLLCMEEELKLRTGTGKVQRLILDYLDLKAKGSKVTNFKTIESYATAKELSTYLQIRLDIVCQAVDSLLVQNKIRIFPNGRRRNRFYGSLILSNITDEEVDLASKMLLNV